MRKRFTLQFFTEPEPNGTEPPKAEPPKAEPPKAEPPVIDYDRLAQIITGKQSAAEDSVLKGYFRQQGLSQEEMTEAIAAYKAEKNKQNPQIKIAELQEKVESYERRDILAKNNVNPDDYDYVAYKAKSLVSGDMTFEKAVQKFVKEHPQFTNKGQYRVSTSPDNQQSGKSAGVNERVNTAIRAALSKR